EQEAALRRVLAQAYARDVAEVAPLTEVDARPVGGVARPARRLPLSPNDCVDKDLRAVPREESAALVMTPTTEANLRLVTAAWAMGRPVLLEGPTSAGKTSMVRFVAWQTGSPYRRINLSYYTDVEDLIGRYVGGEQRYQADDLAHKSAETLGGIALEYGLDPTLERDALQVAILEAQGRPHWVDGPVVKAMKRGEVLLLDEINLARPAVLERLNSLFDDDGNLVLTEHRNEVVVPNKNFRIFATMNPSSYAGREQLSEAMRSRWNHVIARDLTATDLTRILQARYGAEIPTSELAKLIAVHRELAQAADVGTLGRKSGGVAFTLRNLFKVADRFVHFRGSLPDDALMARETREVYLAQFFDADDIKGAQDVLQVAMPYDGPDFYAALQVEPTADGVQVGDVLIPSLATGHALVPKDAGLVMTARTKEILYRLAKALEMGENVGLIGEKASGKTAIAKLYAGMRGQPYYRQMF
ncbi:MAG TPA: AAA family ATPase, partial [Myxococcota bacterium]|nr:AAA family ATPase [Myxococcota bacterium]